MNFHQNIKNYHHNILKYPQNIKNYKAVTTFHSMMLSCAFLPLHQQASACTSEKVKKNTIIFKTLVNEDRRPTNENFI